VLIICAERQRWQTALGLVSHHAPDLIRSVERPKASQVERSVGSRMCDLADLARSLQPQEDASQDISAFTASKTSALAVDLIPLGALVRVAKDENDVADVQLVRVLQRVAYICNEHELELENSTDDALAATILAVVSHVLLQLVSKGKAAHQTSKPSKGRGKKQATAATQIDHVKHTDAYCSIFKALWPVTEQQLDSDQRCSYLTLVARTLVAITDAAVTVNAASTGSSAQPILQRCVEVNATTASWQYAGAAQTLLDGIVSTSSEVLLLSLLDCVHTGGECSLELAAIAVDLRSRVSADLSNGSSKAGAKSVATSCASFLLNFMFKVHDKAVALTILPAPLLAQCLASTQPAVRKLALTCCQHRLALAAGRSTTPADSQAHTASRVQSTTASAVYTRPALSLAAKAPASQAADDLQAQQYAASNDADDSAQAGQLRCGPCPKLAQWLTTRLAHAMKLDADATARKHACGLAPAALQGLVELVERSQEAWPAACAAVLIRACGHAAKDASKIVRGEAMKSLCSMCACAGGSSDPDQVCFQCQL
jgi:hypothetical protein